MSNDVTIIALTLNEIDGVKEILPKIKDNWCKEIIVLDGKSKDGTIEWCESNNYKVVIQQNPGVRAAMEEVMPHVKTKYVITISPDGNCDVNFIPAIIKKLEEGDDLVIGSRYLGDAKSYDDDIVTAFGNWLFTKTVNILFSASFTDVMVIYRGWPVKLIDDLKLIKKNAYSIPERIWFTKIGIEPLMSVRAAVAKKKISEVPAGEPERIGGERKLQIIRWGGAYYTQFWLEFIRKILRISF